MATSMPYFLAGKNAVCTVNGEPMAVESGSYTTSTSVDEMTNLDSDGYYEDESTVKVATVSITAIYNGESPPDFDEGDIITLAIALPGVPAVTGPPAVDEVKGGPALAGNFRVTQMTYPFVTPKVGVKYSFEARSQGAFTKGQSPTP